MPLVIELLHHLTKTWDYYGGSKVQKMLLSDEAIKELKDTVIIGRYPKETGIDYDDIFLIDNYIIELIDNKKPKP